MRPNNASTIFSGIIVATVGGVLSVVIASHLGYGEKLESPIHSDNSADQGSGTSELLPVPASHPSLPEPITSKPKPDAPLQVDILGRWLSEDHELIIEFTDDGGYRYRFPGAPKIEPSVGTWQIVGTEQLNMMDSGSRMYSTIKFHVTGDVMTTDMYPMKTFKRWAADFMLP
jgi:hypothetical protein